MPAILIPAIKNCGMGAKKVKIKFLTILYPGPHYAAVIKMAD
jgi:hypothetical protein